MRKSCVCAPSFCHIFSDSTLSSRGWFTILPWCMSVGEMLSRRKEGMRRNILGKLDHLKKIRNTWERVNLPMQETQVQSLGQEDPMENEMATHSSVLAWRIPWTEEPGGLQSMGSQRVGYAWATNTCPGGPVVMTLPSSAGGTGLIPGWGTKIPHATGCGQKENPTQHCKSTIRQ